MMRMFRGANRLLVVPLTLLALALGIIGTLQYRWLDRVREAERQRMRGDLVFGTNRIAAEISSEINRIFQTFLASEQDEVAATFDDWEQLPHPKLVAAVYVAEREGDRWTLHRLDPATRDLVDARWPAALAPMRQPVLNLDERGPWQRRPDSFFGSIPALFIMQLPARPRPEFIMAKPRRVLLVQLDRQALEKRIGEIVAGAFPNGKDGGNEVAVSTARGVLFQTSAAAPASAAAADVTHRFTPLMRRAAVPYPHSPKPPPPPDEAWWTIAVRHKAGGVETAVASAHRRNLAVAFLILLLLAAAGAQLVALLRRGERLREQQAQFVAAMSHELNTPLSILRVASDNLNDGIVQDPARVSRYVRTIAKETEHLSEMVHQVLELAGLNAGVSVMARDAVDVRATIEEALAQARAMADEPVEIEVDVERDLPPVCGDARALVRVVQNLVTNAIRHAGAGEWIGVRASRADDFVRIAVEDRGPGIEAEDAEQIFEPFYRARANGSVRGTGLGLTIVKEIVTKHGGSVTAERRRGGGAAFIVRLPVGATDG